MELLGCPVADGLPACPRCGGGWPGTKVTSAKLAEAIQSPCFDPNKLGCGTLIERVRAWCLQMKGE